MQANILLPPVIEECLQRALSQGTLFSHGNVLPLPSFPAKRKHEDDMERVLPFLQPARIHDVPVQKQAMFCTTDLQDSRKARRIVLTAALAKEIYGLRPLSESASGKKMTSATAWSREVGKRYDVSGKTVRDIWQRLTWTEATFSEWTEQEINGHLASHRAQELVRQHSSKSASASAARPHPFAAAGASVPAGRQWYHAATAFSATASSSGSECSTPADHPSPAIYALLDAAELNSPMLTPRGRPAAGW